MSHLNGLHLCQSLPVGLQLSQRITQLTLKQHNLHRQPEGRRGGVQ